MLLKESALMSAEESNIASSTSEGTIAILFFDMKTCENSPIFRTVVFTSEGALFVRYRILMLVSIDICNPHS